jgi:hypothetical protein
MAVVSTNGNGFKNLVASFAQVGAIMAEATVKALVSQVAVGNGDDIGSIYHLGWIKSNAIIEPTSVAIVQAIAGLTNVKVGISGSGGQAVAAGVNNCLVNGVNWSAGGSFSLTGAITSANAQKRAWELAGLSADPGGNLEVYATLGAQTSAAGVFTTFLRWYKGA